MLAGGCVNRTQLRGLTLTRPGMAKPAGRPQKRKSVFRFHVETSKVVSEVGSKRSRPRLRLQIGARSTAFDMTDLAIVNRAIVDFALIVKQVFVERESEIPDRSLLFSKSRLRIRAHLHNASVSNTLRMQSIALPQNPVHGWLVRLLN